MPEALTDILTHILPVVDDGPKTMEESVDMALEAFQKGTDRIVATPHQRDIVLNNNLEDARRYLAELNSIIIKRSLPKSPKRILLGMENHMSGELPEQIEFINIQSDYYDLVVYNDLKRLAVEEELIQYADLKWVNSFPQKQDFASELNK